MYEIQLDIASNHVLLQLPPAQSCGELWDALAAHGLPWLRGKALDQLLERSDPCIKVPLHNWRHCLQGLVRMYKFRTREAPENSDIQFCFQGKLYRKPSEIPTQPAKSACLGTFELRTPGLLVIDACYAEVANGHTLNAKPGAWNAYALFRDDPVSGYNVAALAATHSGEEPPRFVREDYPQGICASVGVDSGTLGFFELSRYPREPREHECEEGTFYSRCCEALECIAESYDDNVTREFPAAIVDEGFGVNSQTYMGDGAYPCLVRTDEQRHAVAVAVSFDYEDLQFQC